MKKENKKYVTEEQKEIQKFLLVLLGLVIIIIGIYFFTRVFVTKDLFKENERDYQVGAINYDLAIVGNMLSKPYNEYYVMAFSNEDTQATYYNTLVSKYLSEKKDKALKVYYLDLSDALNKKYVSEDGNSSTLSKNFSLDDLKLGEITLMYVKDGKLSKIITDIDAIKKEWGI